MDKEPEPIEVKPIAEPVKAKKTRSKTIILGVLVLVLIVAAAGASYWWRDKAAKKSEKQKNADISSLQQTTASLEKQLAVEKAKNTKTASSTTQPACTSKTPDATTIDDIEASITSGNTAALEGRMAASVNVVFAAADALSPKTPAQAVSSITDFISSDTSSWDYDFSLSASVLSSYGKGSYSQYFPNNAVVGKASNAKVISFSFDCNAKISTVFMAANEDLLK